MVTRMVGKNLSGTRHYQLFLLRYKCNNLEIENAGSEKTNKTGRTQNTTILIYKRTKLKKRILLCHFKVKRTKISLKISVTIRMLTIQSQGKSTTLNYSQPETDPSSRTRIVHSSERGGILGKTKNKDCIYSYVMTLANLFNFKGATTVFWLC